MKALINLFRRNWGLKLLALILAVFVYYSMRDAVRHDVSTGSFLKGPAK